MSRVTIHFVEDDGSVLDTIEITDPEVGTPQKLANAAAEHIRERFEEVLDPEFEAYLSKGLNP